MSYINVTVCPWDINKLFKCWQNQGSESAKLEDQRLWHKHQGIRPHPKLCPPPKYSSGRQAADFQGNLRTASLPVRCLTNVHTESTRCLPGPRMQGRGGEGLCRGPHTLRGLSGPLVLSPKIHWVWSPHILIKSKEIFHRKMSRNQAGQVVYFIEI